MPHCNFCVSPSRRWSQQAASQAPTITTEPLFKKWRIQLSWFQPRLVKPLTEPLKWFGPSQLPQSCLPSEVTDVSQILFSFVPISHFKRTQPEKTLDFHIPLQKPPYTLWLRIRSLCSCARAVTCKRRASVYTALWQRRLWRLYSILQATALALLQLFQCIPPSRQRHKLILSVAYFRDISVHYTKQFVQEWPYATKHVGIGKWD